MPDNWECGTPKSRNNAFDTSYQRIEISAQERQANRLTRLTARKAVRGHEGAYSRAGTDGGMAKSKKVGKA